jgi:hypothetical protein
MAKAKKTETFNPIRTGVDPRKGRKGGTNGEGESMWLKLDSGVPVDCTCLVEAEDIIVVEQCAIWLDDGNSPVWVYTGPNDPSHELDLERRYKAYLPVMLADGKVKVWGMGKMAHSQLLEIADAVGEIEGLSIRLKRTGAGLNTRYSVISRGNRVDVSDVDEVDVVSMLGPITPDEVKDLLVKKLGLEDYEEVLARYKGKKGIAKSAKTGKTKPVAPVQDEDDDEDDDEIEDLDLE